MSTNSGTLVGHHGTSSALAIALAVTTDSLLFGDTPRGPQAENLRLRMEALDHLPADEQVLVIAMIEGALLRHHARQLNVS